MLASIRESNLRLTLNTLDKNQVYMPRFDFSLGGRRMPVCCYYKILHAHNSNPCAIERDGFPTNGYRHFMMVRRSCQKWWGLPSTLCLWGLTDLHLKAAAGEPKIWLVRLLVSDPFVWLMIDQLTVQVFGQFTVEIGERQTESERNRERRIKKWVPKVQNHKI